MKQLCLVRHAKSDWSHPGLADHERVLNERGRRDGPRMAAALRQRGYAPGLIVASSARRARETAELLAAGLAYPLNQIVRLPELYLAEPPTLLRVIQGLDEGVDCALIVGHNPGMQEAAHLLGSGGVNHFPTLATAWFSLGVSYWGEVEWGSGRLLELLLPRELAD